MKVSVLIATYNRAYIVREAIESALAQSFHDFEIVIVDDGSTDNTRELIESIESDKIWYTRHEKNRGCSAACNTAIEKARGEFVAFLDSDDCWNPDYLERMVGFFTRHPEVDAVFSDVELRAGSWKLPSLMDLMPRFKEIISTKEKADEYVFNKREMYLCLLEEVPIKPTAVVMKRALFERSGKFNELWPSGTDWDLFLRVSQVGLIGYIDHPLAVQRQVPDATHKLYAVQDKIFLLQEWRRQKSLVSQDMEAVQAINRGIYSHTRSLGGYYIYEGKKKESVKVFLDGFKDTRAPDLILRAASALIPIGLRKFLVRAVKGAEPA